MTTETNTNTNTSAAETADTVKTAFEKIKLTTGQSFALGFAECGASAAVTYAGAFIGISAGLALGRMLFGSDSE